MCLRLLRLPEDVLCRVHLPVFRSARVPSRVLSQGISGEVGFSAVHAHQQPAYCRYSSGTIGKFMLPLPLFR